jgi:hypothetical protein
MRSKPFREYVSRFPCCICSMYRGEVVITMPLGFAVSQAAHVVNNGASSKGPDSTCVPLCCKGLNHHAEFDSGKKAFERKYGVNMREVAAMYFARWKQETGQ